MAWKIDPAHAQVTFSARHMMIANVRGRFEKFTVQVDFDENNPINSMVDVQIDAASINTNDPQRDGHLKSPDFLDVENYPYITFTSKRIEKKDKSHGRIIGDLTIRASPTRCRWRSNTWARPGARGARPAPVLTLMPGSVVRIGG